MRTGEKEGRGEGCCDGHDDLTDGMRESEVKTKKEEEKKENSLVVEGLLFSPAENTQWRSSVNTATCMQAQEKVAASTTLGHL